MARGFVNLNRFKHGRATKRDGKQKADLHSKMKNQREGGQDLVAKIDELSFGSIVIEGRKYRRDVLIFADGTVKKRRGGFLGLRRGRQAPNDLTE